MPRVIVCDNAREAARFCAEEDRLRRTAHHGRAEQFRRPARHSPRNGQRDPRRDQRNKRQSERSQRGQRRRPPSHGHSGHSGQKNAGGRPHSTGRTRSQEASSSGETAAVENIPIAPTYDDKLLIGDSVMVRLSRQMGLYAPKNMRLCKGGMTLEALIEALMRATAKLPPTVVVMVGLNNVLQGKSAEATLWNNLVIMLKEKGACNIYFLTLPPMGDKIDVSCANDAIKLLAKPEENISVIDIHDVFMNDDTRNETLFEQFYQNKRPDLIHPNHQGLLLIKKSIDDYILSQMTD